MGKGAASDDIIFDVNIRAVHRFRRGKMMMLSSL